MARARLEDKDAFLAEHPVCCFCGGVTRSAEPDHQPAKVMFDNRQWPEGYVFPACVRCNRASSEAEDIVAFVSRSLLHGPETSDQQREWAERLAAMSHRHRQMLISMEMTANQKRRQSKERGLSKPPGTTYSDMPMLNMEHPKITESIRIFATKLFLALHYKHHGVIVPKNAGIATQLLSNIQVDNGEVNDLVKSLIGHNPTLVRANNDLSDQFNYGYAKNDEDPSIGVYLCYFRRSFALIGFVRFAGFADTVWKERREDGFYASGPFDPPPCGALLRR